MINDNCVRLEFQQWKSIEATALNADRKLHISLTPDLPVVNVCVFTPVREENRFSGCSFQLQSTRVKYDVSLISGCFLEMTHLRHFGRCTDVVQRVVLPAEPQCI